MKCEKYDVRGNRRGRGVRGVEVKEAGVGGE